MFIDVYTQTRACMHMHTHTPTHHYTEALNWEKVA